MHGQSLSVIIDAEAGPVAVAGPMAWNDLPAATRVSIARNSNSSKIVIKTHLFNTVMK